ncbi:MAG TPA: hypothetical protein VNI20_07985 [Fimbriimonadaceae bacterium]|nr:hypothetical protein [Fimbriimonadaceae bacterium]
MAKASRGTIYGILGVVVVAALVFVSSPSTKSGLSATKPKSGSRASAKDDKFDERDRTATFDRLNEPIKNTFRPLVARADVGVSGSGLAPNEFPSAYTGGERGWLYTGTVIVDDVPSASVENQTTGEGYFLKVGEHVKGATISQIAPTYIVIAGINGQSLRLDLLREKPSPGDVAYTATTVAPVKPNVTGPLTGPIGTAPTGTNEQLTPRNNEAP